MFFFKFNLQKSMSPVMNEFILFHDLTLMMTIFIIIFMILLCYSLMNFNYKKLKLIDYSELEMFWTLLPGLMLIILSLPSLKLLYYLDLSNKKKPKFKMKMMGNQWFWSFGMKKKKKDMKFDSYMIKNKESGDFRLLEVDLPLFIPCMKFIRLLVSSNDVMHSFSVNSLGVKIDAVPGRFNFGYFYSSIYGSFFGQCSEICGVNHSFMPIKIEMME